MAKFRKCRQTVKQVSLWRVWLTLIKTALFWSFFVCHYWLSAYFLLLVDSLCDCRGGGNHVCTNLSFWERHTREVRLHKGQSHRGKFRLSQMSSPRTAPARPWGLRERRQHWTQISIDIEHCLFFKSSGLKGPCEDLPWLIKNWWHEFHSHYHKHPSINYLYSFSFEGCRGSWSQSQLPLGERRGTPWTGRQHITGPTHTVQRQTTINCQSI